MSGEENDRGRWRGGSERRSSSSRSRERQRSRSRDRKQRRRRSSSRSRSRDRRRSRDRSRSRDRDRDRLRRQRHSSSSRGHSRDRSRSRSRERQRYRSRSHERRRRRRRGSSSPEGRRHSPGRWQHDRYPFAGGGAQPSARYAGYAAALSAGLDDDWEAGAAAYGPEGGGGGSILRITGLPEDASEGHLRALFEPVAGVLQIRLPRDRDSQLCKGYGFMEFETPEAAAALMQSDWRDQTFFGQARLRFEYARPPPGAAGHPQHPQEGFGGPPADWVCEFCQGINFARRSECYQCRRERSAGARVVAAGAGPGPGLEEPPSCILRVWGLQPSTSEEALRFLFVPHAPVKDIRMLRDKFTGEPRGVAYVQFYSIEAATKALAACQHAKLDTQDTPLHLCYARDRFAPPTATAGDPYYQQVVAGTGLLPGFTSGGALPPEVEAEVALAYAGWEPKEFGEGGGGEGDDGDDPLAAWERQQQQEEAGQKEGGQGQQAEQAGKQQQQQQPDTQQQEQAAAPAAQLPPWKLSQQQEQQQGQAAAAAGYDPHEAAADLAAPAQQAQQAQQLQDQRAAAEAAGFVYDPASGYMRDPVSGYYFDANTGLYCHPTLNQWGSYDFASGQFIPHEEAAAAAAVAAAAAPGMSGAADSALAMTSAQLYSSRQAQQAQHAGLQPPQHHLQQQQQQQQQWRHSQQASARPGEGAQQQQARPRRGAVIGASAKLDPQGLLEAARAAEEKVQLLKKRQELEEAKRKAAARKQAQQAGKAAAAAGAGGAGAAAKPAGAAQGQGVVAGKVYESSWAAARRQQQQQQ